MLSPRITAQFALAIAIASLSACGDETGPSKSVALELVQIVAGSYFTCGLDGVGNVYCWGRPVGNTPPPSPTAPCSESFWGCNVRPVRAETELRFATIDGSFGNLCGTTGARETYCWGDLLVTSDFLISLGEVPTRLENDLPLVGLSIGHTQICGVTSDSLAHCWGDYDFNVRGTGGPVQHDYDFSPNVVAGGIPFVSVESGAGHTCGLAVNGQVFCWGRPEDVGNPAAPVRDGGCGLPLHCVDTPTPIQSSRQFAQISAAGHTCGVTTSGEVLCWGGWEYGPTPELVALPEAAVAVDAGGNHNCAITASGKAYCWGRNHAGQLGFGFVSPSFDDFLAPDIVQTDEPLVAISAGFEHTCALTWTGRPLCWGSNQYGQLGTGDTTSVASPVGL